MLDIVALLIIPVLIVIATFAILFVHSLPEKIAIRRNHPYVDAVVAASWMGLLTLGLLLPLAFLWAFVPLRFGSSTRTKGGRLPAQQRRSIEIRLAELESTMDAMKLEKRIQ